MSQSTGSEATIRLGAWFDDRDVPLDFPSGWDVTQCAPADGSDIGDEGLRNAFANPIGTSRLRDLAAGKQRPCIVIDDLSRPTPTKRLLPLVLEELAAAGIEASDVLLLAGVANHRPLTLHDLEIKVGAEIARACRIANHFSWDGCVHLGETSQGSPVEINPDYLESDLRILVGSIIPHGAAGFSGGSKLLMPGIASLASAEAYHRGSATRGRYAVVETDARLESDEAARMAGVDFIVNSIPSSRMEVAGLVCGDVVLAHREGVEIARRVFASPTPTGLDVCVLSAYPKDSEFLQYLTAFAPWQTAPEKLVREGGTVVVALDGSEGLGSHWLFGPGMRLENKRPPGLKDRHLVFFSPHMPKGALPPAAHDAAILLSTWSEVVDVLKSRHGERASVSVYPCATIQLGSAAGADRKR